MSRTGESRVVELLKASPLLRSIPEGELEQLSTQVHRLRYSANEFIFRKNDEGASLMIIASGRVKIISVSRAGTEVLLNIIERGEVFGEMALLDGKPRSADAVAATGNQGDCVLEFHRFSHSNVARGAYRCGLRTYLSAATIRLLDSPL